MSRSRPFENTLHESLRDTEQAAAYLSAVIAEGDRETFLLALRHLAIARLGSMAALAERSGLNRESLYRMLSGRGNPELASLEKLLEAMGLQLSVTTLGSQAA